MRKSLMLINERGQVLRHNIVKTKAEKDRITQEWRKLYGKKFWKLIVKETYNPKT